MGEFQENFEFHSGAEVEFKIRLESQEVAPIADAADAHGILLFEEAREHDTVFKTAQPATAQAYWGMKKRQFREPLADEMIFYHKKVIDETACTRYSDWHLVDDPSRLNAAISAFRLQPYLTYSKLRSCWKLPTAHLCIDRFENGLCFVELSAPMTAGERRGDMESLLELLTSLSGHSAGVGHAPSSKTYLQYSIEQIIPVLFH